MEQRSRKIEYLITICLSLAFLAIGALSSWPAPVIQKFKLYQTNILINEAGISWMVAMIPVGFIMGSFVTRFTSDRMGRRATVLASAPVQAVGSVIAVFTVEGWVLGIGVFLWSCSTGMLSTVIGIYLAEIADKDRRATLAMFTRFAFSLGNVLVMAIGPFITYEALNYMLLPLPFIYCSACWWIPETPYFLLKEGKVAKAREELYKLRGYNEKGVEEELETIQAGVKREMSQSSSARELFSKQQYRRAVVVSAGIKFTQIMTGGVAVKHYFGAIMLESGVTNQTGFVAFGVVSAVASMMGSFLVDRMGRRPLLITSYLGTGLSFVTVGLYLFLVNVIQLEYLSDYKFIPVLAIILSSVLSTLGFVPLSSIIPSEIFPINVKAVAMTSLSIFGGVLGFLCGKGYQNIKDLLQLHGVFWVYGSIAFFGALFTYFLVPETGGRTLDDIQKELQGDAYVDVSGKLVEVDLNDVKIVNDEKGELVENGDGETGVMDGTKGESGNIESDGSELDGLTKKLEQN